MPPLTKVAAVVLSMGTRPAELRKALETLLAQEGVELDVVLVGNGWRPEGVLEDVRTVHLEENVGIPEGRNIGAREARGDILFFYDDDAFLPTTDVLVALSEMQRPGQTLVGFAAEHGGDPVAHGRVKLERKRVHAVVVNDISDPAIGFESDQNEVTIVTAAGATTVPRAAKTAVAAAIVDVVEDLRSREGAPA